MNQISSLKACSESGDTVKQGQNRIISSQVQPLPPIFTMSFGDGVTETHYGRAA